MTDTIRKRAVFDTNVFLAAHLTQNPNSPTVELLSRWAKDEFDILYCDQLLDEIREKFVERGITQALADEFIDDLRNMGIRVEITSDNIAQVIAADPDDDIIIACAVKGGATHIVTYFFPLISFDQTFLSERKVWLRFAF
jgi:putative PIN family toxin of toxin-antitoxin system